MKRVLCLSVVIVFAASFSAAQTENINGSGVVLDSFTYNSATDVDLFFTATQGTSNAEWFDVVTINLPAAWTIVSLTSLDFDTPSGVGTNSAVFAYSGGPCSGFGINCGAGCALTVKINPNGAMTPGVDATWMLEGDTWGAPNPDSVICSASDPCAFDACYATFGQDQTGLDIPLGTVPVELMSFDIE